MFRFHCKDTTWQHPCQYPREGKEQKLFEPVFAKKRTFHYLCQTKKKTFVFAETNHFLRGDEYLSTRRESISTAKTKGKIITL